MNKHFTFIYPLTDNTCRTAFFLTFLLFVLAPFQDIFATDINDIPAYTISDRSNSVDAPLAVSDEHRRIELLLDYVRKEGPGWAPGLPQALRDPASWALDGMHSIEDRLGLGASNDENESTVGAILAPVSSMMQAPTPEEAQALWLSPNYHHKGFLPIDDAMIMGVNLRHGLFDNRMRFEMHPYYGQNWLSQRGYWGTEFGFDFKAKFGPIDSGKISLGYVNGDSSIMENGHGLDLHSELRFTPHLSLNAGVRQNEDTELGNYVLLRWKVLEN